MTRLEQVSCGNSASCSYSFSSERPLRGAAPAFAAGSHTPRRSFRFRSANQFASVALRQRSRDRSCVFVRAEGDWSPPTVADTKAKFYDGFKRPISGVYNTVVQELLVQHHIMRYNKNYSYDEVFALGFVSTFDQVLDGIPDQADAIYQAYVTALDEEPGKYRADAEKLAEWAKGASNTADVRPKSDGDEVQKLLAGISERAKEGKFLYTKFFAIGLFRLLELAGAKKPSDLGELISAMNLQKDSVNRDLMTYKGILSKLSAAKELMKEFIEREKRKQAEREAEKKAKSESDSPAPAVAADTEKAKA